METLTKKEKDFLTFLLTDKKPIFKDQYFYYYHKGTFYKKSRVIMQLHLNRKLNINEIVHHIDENKEKDYITNLKIMSPEQHASEHHAGKRGRTNKPRKKLNKLPQGIINKIIKLSKIKLHSNGKPNFEAIGKTLNIAGYTASKYINSLK